MVLQILTQWPSLTVRCLPWRRGLVVSSAFGIVVVVGSNPARESGGIFYFKANYLLGCLVLKKIDLVLLTSY
jgi:hypothetical protein